MLYYQQQGQGLPVVFLHGWGFFGDIWSSVTDNLPDYQTFAVDLAGYGKSQPLNDYSLKNIADAVVKSLPLQQPAVWVGWSLGGLIALAIARYYPQKIAGMVLVASTPCFIQRPDWHHAVPVSSLDAFGQQVITDHHTALKRFAHLHLKNKNQRQHLLQQLQQHSQPTLATLTAGLHLLKNSDERDMIQQQHSLLWILGQRDLLIPATLAQVYQAQPQIDCHCIQGAGHLPFISHQQQFLDLLKNYLSSL